MNKVSFLNNKFPDKSGIAVICIWGMGIGMFVSPVMLSIFTFLFGINGIAGIAPRLWLRNKWWLVSVGWVLFYAITWFWSADKAQWGIRLQTKLPFLILPLMVAYLPPFNAKQLQRIAIALAVAMLLCASYSLFFLLRDPAYYIKQYEFSHLLPTRPDDHVRISLAMVLFTIWCVYVWPSLQSKKVKWFLAVILVILVLFIHILAAKSGLLSFYVFLIGWGLYTVFTKKKIAGILILIAIPVCYELAQLIPTFSERINYIEYAWDMANRGDKSGNFGDANRLMSDRIAVNIIKEHPIAGVGTGDMFAHMKDGYHQLYPQVPDANILLPHNQFLIVGIGCGLPAMLLFVIWVFMPLAFIKKNRQSFFFFMVWLLLFIQLLIEPVFEVQIGVFVYLFFLVLQMHEVPGVVKNTSSTS